MYLEGVDISISGFLNIIQDAYQIDDDVADTIVFTYDSIAVSKDKKLNHMFMKLCPYAKDGPLLTGCTVRYERMDGTMGERAL